MGMRHFFIRTILVAGLYWLATLPALAAGAITAEQLVNNAHADGGLIATASACHLPKDTINQLIYQQKKSALDTAKTHQLVFTANDYDEYVVAGFQSTMQFMSSLQDEQEALDAVCLDIEEKIAKKLAENAPKNP